MRAAELRSRVVSSSSEDASTPKNSEIRFNSCSGCDFMSSYRSSRNPGRAPRAYAQLATFSPQVPHSDEPKFPVTKFSMYCSSG